MQASGKTSRTMHSQWWGGFIAAMLPPSCGSLARIHYDDGDIECLDLADGSSQWEFTDFGPGDVGRRLQVVAPRLERSHRQSFAVFSQAASRVQALRAGGPRGSAPR